MTSDKPKPFWNQFSEAMAISSVVITLVISGWVTYENFQRLLFDRLLVRQTNDVMRQIERIESALVHAETGQRGYIITGEEPYLEPYREAVSAVDQTVTEFAKMTADNPQQQQRLPELRLVIKTKLDELALAIEVRQEQGSDAAIRTIKSNVDYKTMAAIRSSLNEMRETERGLLTIREATAERSYRIGVISTFLTTALGLVLVGGVMYLIQHNRRRAMRAAFALRESALQRENYFREMADASPAMIWITDANHQCTFLSQIWYDTTGQTKSEGMGLGWTQAIHPDDRERAAQSFSTAAEKHVSFAFDYRLRMHDGEFRWAMDLGRPRFDASGGFIGYIGNVIDVHEGHLAEENLRTSEGRLRLAAESTGFGTYDYDSTTGEAIWSEQLYSIVGLPTDTVINREMVQKFIYPKDLDKFNIHIQSVLQLNVSDNYRNEFRIVRLDGEVRWVVDSGRVLHDGPPGEKRKSRAVGTIQDITDRKSHEQSLQRAKKTAEAANRSRGEFLANMSHEIRTPMAAILGHAEILNDHLKDPDDRQVVETIRRNGKFLLDIINDILDLSKIDAGKLEMETVSVRLDRLIADVRSLMDVRAAEKKLPLKIEFDGLIPETIETDPVRLRQILLNLIGNAIKFTDTGEVKVVVRYDGGMIFDIIDSGIGIEPEDQEDLFEPFVQADNTSTRAFGGTGLGLTICRRLARALGGDVSLRSQLGKGSTFTLTIQAAATGPLVKPDLNLAKATETSTDDITLSCTVLIVDDRRDIRYLAQHFIEKAGGTVFTAINGKEAIDFIADPNSPTVDMILLDMQMPVMDGYEAASELRRRGCNLPIIALTANAMKSDRDECLAAGCTEYTTKPLNRAVLIAMIDRLTNSSRVRL